MKGGTLNDILRRLALASPAPWTVSHDSEGLTHIVTDRSEGENRLYIKRDLDPADDDDIRFIAMARNIAPRLAEALVTGDYASLSENELDEIEFVTDRASPGPWMPFIEQTAPIGGCSVIWVSGEDDVPDMYVWLGESIADSADIDFIANARTDIPGLVTAIRHALANEQDV